MVNETKTQKLNNFDSKTAWRMKMYRVIPQMKRVNCLTQVMQYECNQMWEKIPYKVKLVCVFGRKIFKNSTNLVACQQVILKSLPNLIFSSNYIHVISPYCWKYHGVLLNNCKSKNAYICVNCMTFNLLIVLLP